MSNLDHKDSPKLEEIENRFPGKINSPPTSIINSATHKNLRDGPIMLHTSQNTIPVANLAIVGSVPDSMALVASRQSYSSGSQQQSSSLGLGSSAQRNNNLNQIGSGNNNFGTFIKCQICRKLGHLALNCWYRMEQQAYPPQVNTATTNHDGWLLDSGATNHVTNNLNNLSLASDYIGTDSLIIGNGQGLRIAQVGNTTLHSLSLPNTLYVPSIHTNLISVAKLCRDNDVIIEFHPSFCLVKDRRTGTILLRGMNNGDVYSLPSAPSPPPPCVNAVSKFSLNDWHCRLGHPALPITQKIISSLGFPLKKCC